MGSTETETTYELVLADRWVPIGSSGSLRCGDLVLFVDPDDPTRFCADDDRGNGRVASDPIPIEGLDCYPDYGPRQLAGLIEARACDLGLSVTVPVDGLTAWYELAESAARENWEACLAAAVWEGKEQQAENEKARAVLRSQRINLATVQPKSVNWFWRPRIARDKVTLLQGDPGVAKSYLTLALAADNSLGGGILPSRPRTEPGRTLLLQVEDGLEDTTVPRLLKLGADLSLIETFGLSEVFVLDQEGVLRLEQHLEDARPSLLVVDPVTFFIGGKLDMHRANEVRQVLAALSRLAEKYDCAIVLVIHMNKGTLKALYRSLGSVDFSAAVRSVLMCGRVEGQPERARALFHVKSNLGPEAEPLGYDVVADAEGDVGRFEFREHTDLTLAEVEGRKPGASAAKRRRAEELVRELLADGPRDSREMKRAAAAEDISDTTLDRAAKRLYVEKERVPDSNRVVWSMWTPGEPPTLSGEPNDWGGQHG